MSETKDPPESTTSNSEDPGFQISPSETPTPIMEVHHHPDLHHKKKKWKEYFLEFLMIFLAVTLGFLAESFREYLGDRHKEHEYMVSLIADLETNQRTLGEQVIHVKDGITMMDSIITILDEPALLPDKTGELYYLARLAPRLRTVSVISRTFEQLKNAGNFRLIRNIEVSNKIMGYYEKVPVIRQIEGLHNNEFDEYKKIAAKVFEPAILRKMETDIGGVDRISDNPPLRTHDPEILKDLAVFSIYMKGSRGGLLREEKELSSLGADLIGFLRKEYQLENE